MKILPIHPQPQSGETLSSWMVRLSFANHFQLHTFYSKVLNYKNQVWTRDVDRNPSVDLLTLLASYSGCPLARFESMTLRHYEGLLYEDVRLYGVAKWIMPLGVFHRTRRLRGIQCCPMCLAEHKPYFRLKWRISLFTICEIHNCFLIDECPRCNANIEYVRLGIGGFDFISNMRLSVCSKCGFDFSAVEAVYPEFVSSEILDDYRNLLSAIADNTWSCSFKFPAQYPLAFFDGFKECLRFVNKRSAVSLRAILDKEFPIGLPIESPSRVEFCYLTLMERFKLIIAVLWLLKYWPDRFVNVIRESNFSRSRFAEDVKALPYWLMNTLDEYLDHRIYVPGPEEIKEVVSYLRRNNIAVSAKTLGKALGLCEDAARSRRTDWMM